MPRHRSFTTATARRKADPITWDIDGVSVRLVATADLADLGTLIDTLGSEPEPGTTMMQAAVDRRRRLLSSIERFIEPDDLDAWRRVESDIDLATLGEMVSELIGEYAGTANPTKQPSSSPGSETTGESSTAGAAPVESTQSD